MNDIKKINETVTKLDGVSNMLVSSGNAPLAVEYISDAKSLLRNIKVEMNTLEGKRILAESQRDSLLLAIAGTNEGRNLELSDTNKAIPQAMRIVRTMDADIRTSREADEIPFGAVEQDSDKMQLEQRIAELELQFELKVDECTATENHLREFKAQWLSLINYINNISPDLLKGIEACNCEGSKIEGNIKAKETKSHELKILPEFFEGVITGEKKAEVRSTNGIKGCYAVGDELWLREWSLETGYTGRDVYREITHVADLYGYVQGYVLLSMKPY